MGHIDRILRSNLKLRHLQLLVALDELRPVGRAAEFLSITQPAIRYPMTGPRPRRAAVGTKTIAANR